MATAVTVSFPTSTAEVFNSVATIAALRALPSSGQFDGANVLVEGSTAAGDGGGGIYVYDVGSLATDNGSSVLKPDDLTALQLGRWLAVGADPVLRTDLSAATGSVLIKHKMADTGTYGRTLRQWGVVGGMDNGNVFNWIDDTLDAAILAGTNTADLGAMVQNALNAVAAGAGGSVLVPNGARLRVNTNLIVPNKVNLSGNRKVVPGHHEANWLTGFGPSIVLDRAANITLQSAAGLSGLLIHPPGITTAQTSANVAAWTGTAIILADYTQDMFVEDCTIVGYETAISKQGGVVGLNPINRPRICRVNIDCFNGVLIARAMDVPYLDQIHCWPFASESAPAELNSAQKLRGGTAFLIGEVSDWTKGTNLFCYGYMVGYDVFDGDQVEWSNCDYDYVPEQVAVGNIGFRWRGTAHNGRMFGCRAAAATNALIVDTASTVEGDIVADNFTVRQADANAVVVSNGSLRLLSPTFLGKDAATKMARAVLVESTATRVSIEGTPRFEYVTTCVEQVANTTPVTVSEKAQYISVTNRRVGYYVPSIAAADGMELTGEPVLRVINTTGLNIDVGTLNGAATYAGRTVTLVGDAANTGTVSFLDGPSINLPGVSFVMNVGDVLRLASIGSGWVGAGSSDN